MEIAKIEKKKTLVLGASTKPMRYSNIAIKMLRDYEHPVVAVGLRKGKIGDVEILTEPEKVQNEEIDTITLYVGPQRQPPYYDWILAQKPQRVIFNPGTENPELMEILKKEGVEPVIACTLVMLRTGQY